MSGSEAIVQALTRLSAEAEGQLTVVAPNGIRGNPHDPERMDGIFEEDEQFVLSFGRGHAVYKMQGVILTSCDRVKAELTAEVLTVTTKPHGGGPSTTLRWRDAALVLTSAGGLAMEMGRTPGSLLRDS